MQGGTGDVDGATGSVCSRPHRSSGVTASWATVRRQRTGSPATARTHEGAETRSVRSVIVFVAALAIVMAFGVEAMLPAFDEIDAEFGFSERGLSVSLLVT